MCVPPPHNLLKINCTENYFLDVYRAADVTFAGMHNCSALVNIQVKIRVMISRLSLRARNVPVRTF